MRTKMTRVGVAFVAGAFMIVGCSKADRSNPDSAAAARTDTGMARVGAAADTLAGRTDTGVNAPKRGGWTDASILGFTAAANGGEIEEGQLAEKKATNAAVKAYARQLVADHRALLNEGKSLGSKLNVTADTTADDVRDLMKDGRDEIKDLTDKKAGADWDEDYIEKQIDGHKKVLDKLQDAAKNTTNPELRAAIEKATGKVQQHLTKAQDIKDNQLKKS
jgi:putative membrane protein